MTSWHDPVVEAVRRVRDQQAAELDYDLKAIFERPPTPEAIQASNGIIC
jgi:hypothetical protein